MHVITNHGTTNGKMVEHVSIIKEGKNIGKKNETSIEEQAKLEVERECVKKKKQGYHLENEENEMIFECFKDAEVLNIFKKLKIGEQNEII